MRVDLWLVENGLAPSRSRAQELIAAGCVYITVSGKTQPIKKPSQQVEPGHGLQIEVKSADAALKYVSRGGLKLEGALKHLRLDVSGFTALDVGLSTGGFADCLLQAGAAQIVGIDVGHGQLADRLKADGRVKSFEGINARSLRESSLTDWMGDRRFDLTVIDVSFISLTLVLPEVISYLKDSAPVLALVKPQFEVGRENLGKNGIVKDASLFTVVESKIRRCCKANGLVVEDYFESAIEGSDGNREFFVYAKSPQAALSLDGGDHTRRLSNV